METCNKLNMLEVVRLGCIEFEANEDVLTQPGNNERVLSAPMAGIQTIGELQSIGKIWKIKTC